MSEELAKLYRDLDELHETMSRYGQEADELHCPDHCSGSGICAKCQLESDLQQMHGDEKWLIERIEALERNDDKPSGSIVDEPFIPDF